MKSNFTVVPEWSFQDIFPEEFKLSFEDKQQTCRVQVKAGNLLFIIQPDGSQLAFSVENIQQKNEYHELKFNLIHENKQPGWPKTSTMTLVKKEDLTYIGLLVGDGLKENIVLIAPV